jgi:G3E family GTPase
MLRGVSTETPHLFLGNNSMNCIVLGGFLGSGKTTALLSLAKHIRSRFPTADSHHPAIAIIENEIGEIGIDNLILESAGYTVKSLFSGCICCTLVGDLALCVNEIVEKYEPPYIAIEATGMAYPDSVVETIKKYSPGCEQIRSVVLVDAKRWDETMEGLDLMIARQARGVDALLLNKIDTIDDADKDRILAELSRLNPGARLFAASARNDSLSAIWDVLIPDIRQGHNCKCF